MPLRAEALRAMTQRVGPVCKNAVAGSRLAGFAGEKDKN